MPALRNRTWAWSTLLDMSARAQLAKEAFAEHQDAAQLAAFLRSQKSDAIALLDAIRAGTVFDA